MARGSNSAKHAIQGDPLYDSALLAKFINYIMLDGKKSTAERIVYGAFDIVKKKQDEEPLPFFERAVEKIRPSVEVRSRRVGGANYQVPMPVPSHRQRALAFRWIIAAARSRSERTMEEKLAGEFADIMEGVGGAVKKKEDVKRQAEANKAFAHFARRR